MVKKMVEKEHEEEMIKRLDESYICYNCKSDLYLCSHANWLCHECENSSDPAIFESYKTGGLSSGGVATLLLLLFANNTFFKLKSELNK